MTRTNLYDYFFLTFLAFVLYGIVQLTSPFAGALLAALMCALTLYPMYQSLRRHFPNHSPSFSAAIANILAFIFLVTPLLLLMWALIQESTSLGVVLKESRTTMTQWREGHLPASLPWLEDMRFFLANALGLRQAQIQEHVIAGVNQVLNRVSVTGAQIAGHAIVFVLNLFLMLFALFFMFRDGEKLYHYVQSMIPMREQDKAQLTSRIHDTVIGIVRGLLLTSLIQGVLATVGYLLVGAQGAVLLGAMTSFMGLVPVVGTCGIWVPVGLFFLLKGAYLKGSFILLWGALVIVGAVDTVIRPYLVGKKVELPLFVLFIALLGGAHVWGAKGLLLGPLLTALVPVLFEMYRQRYSRHNMPVDELSGQSEESTAVIVELK